MVLAGGEGTRLRPLTERIPKAMIPVAGRPILEWIIRWLLSNHISHIVVGLAYKKEVVVSFLDNLSLGISFDYSEHTVEGGTGQGFRLAIERHVRDESFLAMNGDELTDINISTLSEFHRRSGGLVTIAVSPLRSDFGIVETSGDTITRFREKPALGEYLVSTGVYLFQREILDFLPIEGSIERDVFPGLAAKGLLRAYRHDGFWSTVNTVKDLKKAERQLLRSGFMQAIAATPS